MSLSSAIELNDIACSILDMVAEGIVPNGESAMFGSASSSTPAFDALDARHICRTAIVHLQASLERREAGWLAGCTCANCFAAKRADPAAPPHYPPPPPPPPPLRGILRRDHDSVDGGPLPQLPHAEVLHARWQLGRARKVVANAATAANPAMATTRSNAATRLCRPPTGIMKTESSLFSDPSRRRILELLYNRPLRIGNDRRWDQQHSTTACRDHSESISGIVLYNLALCHQVMGLRRGNASYLHNACGLYDMAFQVLVPSGVAGDSSGNNAGDVASRSDDTPPQANSTTTSSAAAADAAAAVPATCRVPLDHHLILLCAAACLHSSTTLHKFITKKYSTSDDPSYGDAIRTRSTTVLTLCTVQRTLALLAEFPETREHIHGHQAMDAQTVDVAVAPSSDQVDTDEAWDLFFFSALCMPLSGLSKAA